MCARAIACMLRTVERFDVWEWFILEQKERFIREKDVTVILKYKRYRYKVYRKEHIEES